MDKGYLTIVIVILIVLLFVWYFKPAKLCKECMKDKELSVDQAWGQHMADYWTNRDGYTANDIALEQKLLGRWTAKKYQDMPY